MKLRNFYSCALMAGAVATLASCSGDELANDNAAPSREVSMTVNITRNSAVTRTTLDELDGNLTSHWEEGDCVLVTDEKGGKLGVLTIVDGAGTSEGQFNGTLTVTGSGEQTYHFFYLGKDRTSISVSNPVIKDFSTQPGLLEQLKYDDFYTSTARVNVSGSSAYTEDMGLTRVVAFGHFELIFPEGVTYTDEDVTISGDGIYNRVSIDMQNTVTFTKGDPATITVPGRRDFYITLLPNSGEPLAPEFRVQIGSKYYKGSLPASELLPSSFIRKSHGIGWPVTMAEYDPDEEPWTDPYPDEDARNPLHKFAKYNLIRQGDASAWQNVLASSEDENGALYQWGRNYGYMDTKGIYENSNTGFDPGDDFTNYVDAMGTITYDWDNLSSKLDYYVFETPNNGVISATGCHINKGYYWNDTPYTYSSADDIKEHPNKYFMDARVSGRTEDYWISAFGNGGSTWEERAEKCGYENANPCPAGWRIPTEAEMRAILPETNVEASRTSLTQLLNNTGAQLRVFNGIKYVIRWMNTSNYVEVQAVVVDDDFTSSQITSDIWLGNNVVVRRFPYTGHIDNIFGYNYYVDVYYARPYGRYRTVNSGIWIVNQGHDGSISPYDIQYLMVGPTTPNYGISYGAYWVSDGIKAMKFSDRQSFELSSYFEIGSSGAAMGFAIRPVMDK